MTTRCTRRRFLQGTAATVGVVAGSQLFPVPRILAQGSPNAKLNCAVIGVANQGMASISGAVTERVVALCDVDDSHLDKTRKWIEENNPEQKPAGIKTFCDYRKMLDEMHKDIDVVFVATPDHHHCAAALRAMMLNKHVYVEKPLAHSIEECRRLTEAARKYKVVTQMGNQGHSGEGLRRLVEYLASGAIGAVTETYSWAPTGRGGVGGRLPTKPVPAGLHWDEWIGPAHFRDYHDELHPIFWRSWWEFGDGSVGDWGCHNLDGPYTALKLAVPPTSVEVLEQAGGSDERFPLRNAIRWTFPARGKLPPVKVHWYDGYFDEEDPTKKDDEGNPLKVQNRPPIVAELEKKFGRDLKNGGTIYVGEKGIMHTGNYAGSPRIMPEEQHRATPVPAKVLPRIKGTHAEDFLRCCKEGKQPASHFDYAGPFCEMVLLGCLAERVGPGKKIEWDSAAMTVKNMPELNPLIKREYRPGWMP